jgi:epoxyqueuosine reductase
MLLQQTVASFKEQAKAQFGFEQIEFIPLPEPASFYFYQTWIEQGLHGEMKYLADHLPAKQHFSSSFPAARTAMVVTARYAPHPQPDEALQWKRIARYARGKDYHHWLNQKLIQACELLRTFSLEFEFIVATDSKPILERDLAKQAGLGWVGKNTCLIHPKFGSYFFIGEALLSVELENPATFQKTKFEVPDFCGSCTACIDSCPTGALEEPKKLNANKCLAHWNIEARSIPPDHLRDTLGKWFFGCDICQEVCPWNQKFFRQASEPSGHFSRQQEIEFLRKILTSSNRELLRSFNATPLMRARPSGLKRNAILVAVKLEAFELIPEIKNLGQNDQLKELVDWALTRISNKN